MFTSFTLGHLINLPSPRSLPYSDEHRQSRSLAWAEWGKVVFLINRRFAPLFSPQKAKRCAMKIIRVPEWAEALRKAQLPDSFRRSAEISIRWYLSFCRRARV